MRITVIGGGNIGGATAIGLSSSPDIVIKVTTKTTSSCAKFSFFGNIEASNDNSKAVEGSRIVFLAVKPWLMEEVVKDLLPSLNLEKQLIACVAPGIKSSDLISWLGAKAKLAYVIPNTAIEMGESMTFIAPVTTSREETLEIKALMDKAGDSIIISEDMLLAATSLASCGIAYALDYIKASSLGGQGLGFNEKDSVRIVKQTVKGAISVLEKRNGTPQAEIDKVTTPGGMTIRGLNAMEEAGFTEAVIKGLYENK